jgi:hypothetical protein
VFGNTISRTFTISSSSGRSLDGFEVIGAISIPEPTAFFLLGVGGFILVLRRHRLG